MNIEGFAEISAKSYVDNYDNFFEFIKDINIKIINKQTIKKDKNMKKLDLTEKVFVFTGVRDKVAEGEIEMKGGRVSSAVSSKTTHLVMKEKNSGSLKEQKAIELGIEIITIDELRKMLFGTDI